jgi:hypothetical protein
MAVKLVKEHLKQSKILLGKYQKGDLKLIQTNRPWLDAPGGILRQSIITILGASFSGKTTELENLREDIMNVEINPEAADYVSLSHAFEMSNFSLMLKSIKKLTGKTYKEILNEEFDQENTDKLKEYFEGYGDERFSINHETGSPEEIADQTEEFLKNNTDKKLCLISLDHTALLKSKQDNKKASIDDMVERFNTMKFKYPNFVLVLLTQANRKVLDRIKEKSNDAKLRRDDIYASDTVFHISDYVYGLQNAFYLGIEEYRKVRPVRYPHLEHRFTDEDKKGKVSLHTEGCIFVEVLKDRMADDLDFTDLYTIEIKEFDKTKIVKETKEETPKFTIDSVQEPIAPASLEDAFGPISPSDDPPF